MRAAIEILSEATGQYPEALGLLSEEEILTPKDAFSAMDRFALEAWNEAIRAAANVVDGWPDKILLVSEQQEEILRLLKEVK